MVRAVLSKMGIPQMDGVLTEFGSLIPGLQAGRFDIIAAGMFVTPKRCEQIQFSEPTYGIGQAFLVGEGNPKGIEDYSSIAENDELKLAVMAGAVEGGYAKDAGIPMDQLVVLPDQSSLVKAVQAGRADAAALTALSIADMAAKNDGVESTEPFGTVAGQSVVGHGAIGFRQDDADLYEAFNAALKDFIGSEEHVALVTPFGFGKGFLPVPRSWSLPPASSRRVALTTGAASGASPALTRVASKARPWLPISPIEGSTRPGWGTRTCTLPTGTSKGG